MFWLLKKAVFAIVVAACVLAYIELGGPGASSIGKLVNATKNMIKDVDYTPISKVIKAEVEPLSATFSDFKAEGAARLPSDFTERLKGEYENIITRAKEKTE